MHVPSRPLPLSDLSFDASYSTHLGPDGPGAFIGKWARFMRRNPRFDFASSRPIRHDVALRQRLNRIKSAVEYEHPYRLTKERELRVPHAGEHADCDGRLLALMDRALRQGLVEAGTLTAVLCKADQRGVGHVAACLHTTGGDLIGDQNESHFVPWERATTGAVYIAVYEGRGRWRATQEMRKILDRAR